MRCTDGSLSITLIRAIRASSADVVVIQTQPLTSLGLVLGTRARFTPPVVLITLLQLGERERLGLHHRLMARLADHYVALTAVLAPLSRDQAALPPQRVSIIPPALTLEIVSKQPPPHAEARSNSTMVVGYMGRLSLGKDLGALIDAFALVAPADSAVKLLLAGMAVSDTEDVRARVDRLDPDIRRRVVVLADFDEATKLGLIEEMNVLVNPSALESFGIVFADA